MPTNTFAPLFSIIIPVYNVEKYLEKCLQSILNQTFEDYELIIVNDGSIDSSGSICQLFLTKFKNSKYFYQENAGAAIARNNGLKKAIGEYIIFIDSDDYLFDNNALKDIANLIKEKNYPDVILHKETRISPNGRIFPPHFDNKIYNHSFKKEAKVLINNGFFKASPCDKIVRRELLINNNIFFPPGLKAEDMEWTANLMLSLNTFCCFPNSFYMYRHFREGSQSNTINKTVITDVYLMLSRSCSKQLSKEDIELINHFWADHYCLLLIHFNLLKNSLEKEKINDIKNLSYLLATNSTKNVSKLNKAYSLLGFNLTVIFLKLYMIVNNFLKKRKNYN
ncbi:glycosyltransferase [Flavobacterium agricola]|uniref:Glycosyltransferase n=1 Tax=Flavobacterium agricola TaxID=2870839 RepID=A0ABY6LXR1_9FLAO|nr:glycosyltransferase [Flavobacterium agricola]UYW00961.1 glycosyltransferase [Flavobacterium agricola]